MTSLRAEIDRFPALTPTLWWLGHAGFAIKYHGMIFYIDPRLDGAAPLDPADVNHADLVLASHDHPSHLHASTIPAILAASPRAKLVLPKAAAARAHSIGVSDHRMTTTDSGLRVEYFKDGDYVRFYAIPSAHGQLDYQPGDGYPYLGYLIRGGSCTIYHAGDCVPYDGLADRLRPFNVTVAILPVAGRANFTIDQAAQLAADIGARWLVPMHYSPQEDTAARFLDHLLFHRPEQRFKIFDHGEGWPVPEDTA
jgi:L-ascorbate metabolism protein UlaG (beta-lactamase superfamily)